MTDTTRLLREWKGQRSCAHIADLLLKVHGIQRTPEAVRRTIAEAGEGSLRAVSQGDRPLLWYIADVLGVPDKSLLDAQYNDIRRRLFARTGYFAQVAA